MELYIAGGCAEHGRNCFLVKGGRTSFFVDAGLMKDPFRNPYPRLTGEQIGGAGYLFLTHCHADHTGALPFLFKHGFRGKIITTRFTSECLRLKNENLVLIDRLSQPGESVSLGGGLSVLWGRSGHCMGSIWLLVSFMDKKLLFTGDYTEHSQVYKVDKIRGMRADVAVIDCAYGHTGRNGDYNLEAFRNEVADMKTEKRPMLFPVPAHGRGFDVIRELLNQEIPVYADKSLISELMDTKDRGTWLRKRFIRKLRGSVLYTLDRYPVLLPFVKSSRSEEKHRNAAERESESRYFTEELEPGRKINGAMPGRKNGKGAAGILIRDSQLFRFSSRASALELYGEGGITILTGKQLPDSYAKTLLDSELAVFRRLSVHQNADELLLLREKNEFKTIVPFHCGSSLTFDKKNIQVMHPGEILRL
ncbi:MAG: MBL fold metallo-hydrolase [Lachnospiraceae bacterium]|nr:MBL fold metallo-hydrolase [Lachnospiraceae bacterium]